MVSDREGNDLLSQIVQVFSDSLGKTTPCLELFNLAGLLPSWDLRQPLPEAEGALQTAPLGVLP